jgi:hypothetical protein
MGNKEWSSSLNNDKKGGQKSENVITTPRFHINSCTMSSNKTHDANNEEPPPLSLKERNQVMNNLNLDIFALGSDNALTLLLKAARYDKNCKQEGREKEEPVAGPANQPPPQTTVEDVGSKEDVRSKQTSLALTEELHPGYPYRENINNNEDLPKDGYPRPYLAVWVNHSNGDPRVIGKAEKGAPIYDEGPLTAQPWVVVNNDIEAGVATYPLRKNAFLDTDFLQAVGELNDRGLVAECLRLAQLDGEFRYLDQWE